MKPLNAASIWIEGFHIVCNLPAPDGNLSHEVRFVDDPAGYRQLMNLLRHRDSGSKIGTKGDPVKHQIERGMLDGKPAKKAKSKPSAEERTAGLSFLRSLGMNV